MARTATVTKKSVNLIQPKLWNVVLNLQYKEDAVVLFDQDFSLRYRTGDVISEKVQTWVENMQKAISDYKAEEVIQNSTALNNAVNSIQAALEV